jgi:hypothetical protein
VPVMCTAVPGACSSRFLWYGVTETIACSCCYSREVCHLQRKLKLGRILLAFVC